MKPNVLVCGKTGAGKTSLIQAVTHAGTVPDEAIGNAAPATRGFDVYETAIANFIDCEGMEPGQTVDEYSAFVMGEVVKRLDLGEAAGLVHAIWYCIDGSGARVQSADARLIRQFSDKALLVVTKAETLRKGQAEAMTAQLLDLLPEGRIVMVSSHGRTGLGKLLDKSKAMAGRAMGEAGAELAAFRGRWEEYYRNMRAGWEQRASDEADEYVNWATGRAAAIAAVPLPLADLPPLMANEAYMICRIGAAYGYAVDKSMLTMLAGVGGGSLAGKLAASFLPFLKIPIAAGITYGVGKAAKAYFASGMTLGVDDLKRQFLEGEKEAKATDWKGRAHDDDWADD
ncbi:MAG: GTPase domain-containing protein [Planctomycetes bacterium]|nr:GTPase domain-containing protein [Planctomycetota bacterium]